MASGFFVNITQRRLRAWYLQCTNVLTRYSKSHCAQDRRVEKTQTSVITEEQRAFGYKIDNRVVVSGPSTRRRVDINVLRGRNRGVDVDVAPSQTRVNRDIWMSIFYLFIFYFTKTRCQNLLLTLVGLENGRYLASSPFYVHAKNIIFHYIYIVKYSVNKVKTEQFFFSPPPAPDIVVQTVCTRGRQRIAANEKYSITITSEMNGAKIRFRTVLEETVNV